MIQFRRMSAGANRFAIEVSGSMCDTLEYADSEETKMVGFEAPADYVSPMPHHAEDFHSRLELVVRPSGKEAPSEPAPPRQQIHMPHWNNAGLRARMESAAPDQTT